MKQMRSLLVPTDLRGHSRRGIETACDIAIDNGATMTILYVANNLQSLMIYSEFLEYQRSADAVWPVDRVINEAHLDLNRFLEPLMPQLKRVRTVHKRVVLGSVPEQSVKAAQEEKNDLIIMSPKRNHTVQHYFGGSITDRVTRRSPCPVLSVMEPIPSHKWRGKVIPMLFGWPRTAAL